MPPLTPLLCPPDFGNQGHGQVLHATIPYLRDADGINVISFSNVLFYYLKFYMSLVA